MKNTARIFLASGSPRRKELLAQLGYQFEILVPNIVEQQHENEKAYDYVSRLSKDKAFAAQIMKLASDNTAQQDLFIGSDTIVVLGEQVLEKPIDFLDSARMLSQLSGRCHQVMTAVTVVKNETFKTDVVVTDVWFKPLTQEEIEHYWQTGEPCDKAGSYAIQGFGGKFVTRIEGSYYAVVGLPLFETNQLLNEFL